MSNFFRKDLNLEKKWRHRLLAVLFFSSFVYCFFNGSKRIAEYYGDNPIYEVKSSLAGRITSEVKSAKELLNTGELLYNTNPEGVLIFLFWRFGEGKYKILMGEKFDNQNLCLDGLFCADKLSIKIDEVMKKTGIYQFYIKDINNYSEPVSIKVATEYINTNNIKCVLTDAFGSKNKFLNPGLGQECQNNYYFYEKTEFTNFLTIIVIITGIIAVFILLTIPFGVLVLIYYKIIIYITYGNKERH